MERLKDNKDVPGLRDEGGIGVTRKEPWFSSESSMATSLPQEKQSLPLKNHLLLVLQQSLMSNKHDVHSGRPGFHRAVA